MLDLLAALALLAAMGSLGVAALVRLDLGLGPLELIALGGPAGVVAGSLLLVPVASAYGFMGPVLVVGVGAVCAGAAYGLCRASVHAAVARSGLPDVLGLTARPPLAVRAWAAPEAAPWRGAGWAGLGSRLGVLAVARVRGSLGPILTLGALIAVTSAFCLTALTREEDGIWANQQHIWSDWSLHLGHVASFTAGDNFPPQNTLYAGVPLAYHYLSAVTAAAMVEVGMDPIASLEVHTLVFTVATILGLYAFVRRLLADRAAAALATVLFFLGGGLGWLLTLREAGRSGDLLGTLRDRPWDYGAAAAAEFRWEPAFIIGMAPTRAFLYGIPLALLTLTLLVIGLRTGRRAAFVAAGGAAGLLPFAHLGTLLALALVAPFLVLLFPSRLRDWAIFGAVWVAVTLPQMALLRSGAADGVRWHTGWVVEDDPLVWFWLKNAGLFLPLVVFALANRRFVASLPGRLLLAFMPLFVLANVVSFSFIEWDNIKVVVWWFFGASILAAVALVRAWRAAPEPLVRATIGALVLGLVLSGLLMHLHVHQGGDRAMMVSADDIALAETVRAETAPGAVFATGLQHNQPIPIISGRQTLLTFWSWLRNWGIDYAGRERDVRAIYALAPETPALLETLDVDYVVVGPVERRDFGADPAAFAARYPLLTENATYQVFAVSPAAIGRLGE